MAGPNPGAQIRPDVGPGFKGILHTHRTDIWSFVCTSCGYVEVHLIDPEAVAFAEREWAAVPFTPPPG
jgi:hypothetical protein